jgi:murein L,D-transpeptidase YafK
MNIRNSSIWLVFSLGLISVSLLLNTSCIRGAEKPVTSIKIVAKPENSKPSFIYPRDSLWLDINTKDESLRLMLGEDFVKSYDNIALGSSGAGIKRYRGDGITPLGQFKIAWLNPYSKFKHFFGINYPNFDYARQGLNANLINKFEFNFIKLALQRDVTPPQNTSLGGNIGIHGVGFGADSVHQVANWTDGCIALSNSQISDLYKQVNLGMTVIIR